MVADSAGRLGLRRMAYVLAAFGGEFENSASGKLAFPLQNGFGGFV